MALTKTPICNFGEKAKNFNLMSGMVYSSYLKHTIGNNLHEFSL